MIKSDKKKRKQANTGCKVFYVGHYDPRVPQPRKLISRNYHLLANNPSASKLFPRRNLVSGTKRLPNLSEILAPTVPRKGNCTTGQVGDDGRPSDNPGDDENNNTTEQRWNGSYHCENYKKGKSCDLCSHMDERSCVTSLHFKTKHAIHGHLVHRPAGEKNKLTWFVYLIEDLTCQLQYVGSTQNATQRWSSTKSACNSRNKDNTGLYKHYMNGCPNDDRAQENLRFTLLDSIVTSLQKLEAAKHEAGPKCRCSECLRLKSTEDKWICRLGTFFGQTGLNSRDEIKGKVRCTY